MLAASETWVRMRTIEQEDVIPEQSRVSVDQGEDVTRVSTRDNDSVH